MNRNDDPQGCIDPELRILCHNKLLGRLRLFKDSPEYILELCADTCLDPDCQAVQRDTFLQFAREELHRIEEQLANERTSWAVQTDCDRLDRVEAALRRRGILLWQASPCCDSCTLGDMSQRVETTETRFPGFARGMRGYAFFIDQNVPEALEESTVLSVYFAYGALTLNELTASQASPEYADEDHLAIAREVCDCLRTNGFEVDWNGELSRKIGVCVNWQRRTRLE